MNFWIGMSDIPHLGLAEYMNMNIKPNPNNNKILFKIVTLQLIIKYLKYSIYVTVAQSTCAEI